MLKIKKREYVFDYLYAIRILIIMGSDKFGHFPHITNIVK